MDLERWVGQAVAANQEWAAGFGPFGSRMAYVARKLALPAAWLIQQPPIERRITRIMWGPDAVELIASARKLHREALARRL